MEKRTKELAATLETELLPKMQGGRTLRGAAGGQQVSSGE